MTGFQLESIYYIPATDQIDLTVPVTNSRRCKIISSDTTISVYVERYVKVTRKIKSGEKIWHRWALEETIRFSVTYHETHQQWRGNFYYQKHKIDKHTYPLPFRNVGINIQRHFSNIPQEIRRHIVDACYSLYETVSGTKPTNEQYQYPFPLEALCYPLLPSLELPATQRDSAAFTQMGWGSKKVILPYQDIVSEWSTLPENVQPVVISFRSAPRVSEALRMRTMEDAVKILYGKELAEDEVTVGTFKRFDEKWYLSVFSGVLPYEELMTLKNSSTIPGLEIGHANYFRTVARYLPVEDRKEFLNNVLLKTSANGFPNPYKLPQHGADKEELKVFASILHNQFKKLPEAIKEGMRMDTNYKNYVAAAVQEYKEIKHSEVEKELPVEELFARVAKNFSEDSVYMKSVMGKSILSGNIWLVQNQEFQISWNALKGFGVNPEDFNLMKSLSKPNEYLISTMDVWNVVTKVQTELDNQLAVMGITPTPEIRNVYSALGLQDEKVWKNRRRVKMLLKMTTNPDMFTLLYNTKYNKEEVDTFTQLPVVWALELLDDTPKKPSPMAELF